MKDECILNCCYWTGEAVNKWKRKYFRSTKGCSRNVRCRESEGDEEAALADSFIWRYSLTGQSWGVPAADCSTRSTFFGSRQSRGDWLDGFEYIARETMVRDDD